MFESTIARVRRHPVWASVLLAPYVLLIVLNAVNPFLRDEKIATYCPLPIDPTVLEGNIWIFPSPIIHWVGYAVWFLIIYIVIGTIVRVVNKSRQRKLEAVALGEDRSSVFEIISPFFKLMMGLFVLAIVIEVLDGGSYHHGIEGLLFVIFSFLNEFVIPIILGVGFIMFIWGAFRYLIPGLDGDNVARREGRILMSISIFFGVIIILFWGVINLLTSSTGLEETSFAVPTSVGGGGGFANSLSMPSMDVAKDTIGFAVGGAKDADNFRKNIENCYLPTPTDITYEGMFFDYIFETKNNTGCTDLFCPQYEAAVVPDPFSQQEEYFLSVGLGSNINADTFSRVPLDVVVVIDISGSMSSPFDQYHYDRNSTVWEKVKNSDWNASKMEIAKEAMGAMADRLQPDDRFGLVTFESSARTILDPYTMGQNGYAKAKNSIATLGPLGGTNMAAGLEEGTRLIKSIPQEEGVDRERRIIFLTDAMPNTGAVEQNDLYKIGKRNAEEGIHTTFIGVGVDFNTELVEALTKELRGANYYSIHSSHDFEKRLDIEFEYMVAPLVYDLTLQVEGGDYGIRTVYGSPEADLSTGEIIKVSTLFPSPSEGGSSRGGVILAHMNKVANTGTTTKVTASYTDRAGVTHSASGEIDWSEVTGDAASPNVRKAVLLSRYVSLVQNWIIDENTRLGRPEKTIYKEVYVPDYYSGGLVIPKDRYTSYYYSATPYELNYWERLSRNLVVSEDYKGAFRDFGSYMEEEMKVVSESDRMKQELELLKNLENSPDSDYDPDEKPDNGISRQ